MSQKFMKSTSNSEQTVIKKSTERQKANFQKGQLVNTDLHKPVLNKMMTTQDQCVNYNLVAPLTTSEMMLYDYCLYTW